MIKNRIKGLQIQDMREVQDLPDSVPHTLKITKQESEIKSQAALFQGVSRIHSWQVIQAIGNIKTDPCWKNVKGGTIVSDLGTHVPFPTPTQHLIIGIAVPRTPNTRIYCTVELVRINWPGLSIDARPQWKAIVPPEHGSLSAFETIEGVPLHRRQATQKEVEVVVDVFVNVSAEGAQTQGTWARADWEILVPFQSELVVEVVVERLDQDGGVFLKATYEEIEIPVVTECEFSTRSWVNGRILCSHYIPQLVGESQVEPIQRGSGNTRLVQTVELCHILRCSGPVVDESEVH